MHAPHATALGPLLLAAVTTLAASVLPQETAAERVLVLDGATLHDGNGGPPLPDAVIVVRGERIAAAGARSDVAVPEGAERFDCRGQHVIPGLIDTHVHYSQTGWADGRPDAIDVRAEYPYARAMTENELHPERFHRAFLACGVTAVFDVGGYPWTRRLGARTEHDPLAPHVRATGALLTTWEPEILGLPDRKQFVAMRDADGARAAVRSHSESGSDAIKIWFITRSDLTAEQSAPLVRAVGDEARRLGLPLVVHATSLEAARIAVEAGAKLLVHSVDDQPVDDAFVAACREQGTFYCPTLTVVAGYHQLYARAPSDAVLAQLEWVHPTVAQRVRATAELGGRRPAPAALEGMARRRALQVDVMAENLLRLHRAGVPVVLGTDAGNPLTLHGPSVFVELEAMQAAGLTPAEVLVAATRDAARAIGRGDDLGVVAPGRIADLVLLVGDPAADIANVRRITHVCRGGTLHPRAALVAW